jgi:aldose 1-epimerase
MIERNNFGSTQNGTTVDLFTIKNSNGIELSITNYGCRITSLIVPDKYGKHENILLGYKNIDYYLNDEFYLGAVVGRFANRIAKGSFTLGNNRLQLPINNGVNHLHGGINGFDKKVWHATKIVETNKQGVKFFYKSNNGEEGYPGELDVEVTYLLTNNNELQINYKAETNKTTHINLTNHSYFNLSGNFNNSIVNHKLRIYSDKFLEMDSDSIPTGKIISTNLTPFNFQDYKTIGEKINDNNYQIKNGNGYDHCFIFENENKSLKLISELFEPKSGRLMEVYTTEPAVQLYSGNFLSKAKTNQKFGRRTGLCLETQHYPDSPNHPEFPTTILHPEKAYSSQSIYRFKTK